MHNCSPRPRHHHHMCVHSRFLCFSCHIREYSITLRTTPACFGVHRKFVVADDGGSATFIVCTVYGECILITAVGAFRSDFDTKIHSASPQVPRFERIDHKKNMKKHSVSTLSKELRFRRVTTGGSFQLRSPHFYHGRLAS